MITGSTNTVVVRNKKESEARVNSWFSPINPISQVIEYFYKQRKNNG